MTDREVVDRFVEHLASREAPGLVVDRRPDDENRSSSDIDAIAGRFAVEHTSIDTVLDQRLHDDWFMQVVDGLETELSPSLPCRLRIAIAWDAVRKGQDWAAVREALSGWVLREAAGLPEGCSVVDSAPGIPFGLRVTKASDRPPRLVFMRLAPQDDTLSARVRRQLDRKAAKLKPYREKDFSTILLVESSDIALMSDGLMIESLQQAYAGNMPDGVDRVWFVDTSIPEELEFQEFTAALAQGLPNNGIQQTIRR